MNHPVGLGEGFKIASYSFSQSLSLPLHNVRMSGWTNAGSLEELMNQFPTEDSCIPALFALKWPHGYRCPNCKHPRAYVIRTRRLPLYECSCHHQTSLTVGTIMEGSRTSLRKWITAMWLVSRSDKGINAVKLSSMIEVTSKTAWAMLHKIRTAIAVPMRKSRLRLMFMALSPFAAAVAFIPVASLYQGNIRLSLRPLRLRMGRDINIR